MINDKEDEVIEQIFQSLLSRYQIGLETLMKRNDCIFDCTHPLFYKCHIINCKRGGSYIS